MELIGRIEAEFRATIADHEVRILAEIIRRNLTTMTFGELHAFLSTTSGRRIFDVKIVDDGRPPSTPLSLSPAPTSEHPEAKPAAPAEATTSLSVTQEPTRENPSIKPAKRAQATTSSPSTNGSLAPTREARGGKTSARTASLLSLLGDSGAWMMAVDLKKQSGLPPSTFWHLMSHLVYEGVVERGGNKGTYKYRRAAAPIPKVPIGQAEGEQRAT